MTHQAALADIVIISQSLPACRVSLVRKAHSSRASPELKASSQKARQDAAAEGILSPAYSSASLFRVPTMSWDQSPCCVAVCQIGEMLVLSHVVPDTIQPQSILYCFGTRAWGQDQMPPSIVYHWATLHSASRTFSIFRTKIRKNQLSNVNWVDSILRHHLLEPYLMKLETRLLHTSTTQTETWGRWGRVNDFCVCG